MLVSLFMAGMLVIACGIRRVSSEIRAQDELDPRWNGIKTPSRTIDDAGVLRVEMQTWQTCLKDKHGTLACLTATFRPSDNTHKHRSAISRPRCTGRGRDYRMAASLPEGSKGDLQDRNVGSVIVGC